MPHYPGRRTSHRDVQRSLRGNHRNNNILREPLLLHPPNNAAATSISPRGNVELTNVVHTSAYRPPRLNNDTSSQAVRRETTYYPLNAQQGANNKNPAQDLSWTTCSHGCCCWQCVRTQELGFSEQCGAFQEIQGPGCYCMVWPFHTIAGRLSLRIQQMNVTCETKTWDDVLCHVTVCVLFRVNVVRSYEAYYRLDDPRIQIQAYILDVVRSTVPTMTLDHVYSSQTKIADTVFSRLSREMIEFGYEITSTLVTNVMPNIIVRDAMNEINASRRIKDAAPFKAEAMKIQTVKDAEARAQAMYLRGVGISNGRMALAQSMHETIDMWTSIDVRIVHPPTPKDVMYLLLVTQYMDVLSSLAPGSSLLLDHQPRH